MKNLSRIISMVVIVAGTLIIWAWPAAAICHVVNFSQTNYDTKEDAGSVDITINRVILSPGCTGTLEYSTVDDSAKAPSDYTHTSGTRQITNTTEASFTFKVPITDDQTNEQTESFKVTFKHTPGNGQSVATGTSTVTIQDNDPPPPPPPAAASPKPSPSPSPSPTKSPSPSPSPSPEEESPSPTEEASPTPEVVTTQAADEGDDGGLPTGVIVALAAAIVAVGAGGGLLYLRRRGAQPPPVDGG